MNKYRNLGIGLVFLGLTACAADRSKELADKSPQELYALAQSYQEKGDIDRTAEIFDEIDRQHPYSPLATKAQLQKANARYEEKKYPEALAAYESFIQLHPGHEQAAFAHYRRALCYYEQITHVKRDQKIAEQAMQGFEEVMRRFPHSDYAKDAKMKHELAIDHMAGKEMEVGRFYLHKNAHTAALNRFKRVAQAYQETSHVPESLHRMVECYKALGLEKEAIETAAVLGHNFADSDWYKDTYYLLEGVDLRQSASADRTLLEKLMGKAWTGRVKS